ncbi:MAG: hypothetical protein QM767_18740 [Anaeromyxobacter sp.]
MTGVTLLMGVLATWRLTHLVVAEDGPWNLVARLRLLAGAGMLGQLMDCFKCASLWVSVPFAAWLSGGWREGGLAWLAFSGGAILLERLAQAPGGDH